MKKCSKCGIEKELAEFSKRNANKDGLSSQCKACVKAYNEVYHKAYRVVNKDKRKAYDKAYRAANKEKRKAYNKTWCKANEDKHKAYKKTYNKAYYEANKDKQRAYREVNRDKRNTQNKAWCEAKKSERIEQLKNIIEPNTDDQWVYIMQCGVYNKIGISNDPLRRVEEIRRKTQAPTEIIYLAKPFHGRTKDCEKIIHHELKCFNVPIPYAGSYTTSREWFFCSIDEITKVIFNYCEIKEMYN